MHLRWTGCSSASCRISNDRGVHEGCHVNPHREDVRWVRLDEHAQTEFNVLPVHCVNLGVLDQPPALIERHKGGIEWESPYALVDGISILHLSEEFFSDLVNLHMLVPCLGVCRHISEFRHHSSFSFSLWMLLAVRQDAPQFFIECNGPLRCLPHFRDSLLLEHLDQVLLNSCLHLRDCVLREGWGVDDVSRLLDCAFFTRGSEA